MLHHVSSSFARLFCFFLLFALQIINWEKIFQSLVITLYISQKYFLFANFGLKKFIKFYKLSICLALPKARINYKSPLQKVKPPKLMHSSCTQQANDWVFCLLGVHYWIYIWVFHCKVFLTGRLMSDKHMGNKKLN